MVRGRAFRGCIVPAQAPCRPPCTRTSASLVSESTSMLETPRRSRPVRGDRRNAPIRDRRSGAGRDLRDLLRRPGHHLHVLRHSELRLRRHRLLHRPLLLLPQHATRLGHHPGRGALHPRGVAGVGGIPLRRLVPPPAPVVADDQGGGDHRPPGGHPLLGHLDLRQPGDSGGPRSGPAARRRVPGLRRGGHAGPAHRLRVRGRDRRCRRVDLALHRRRPQGARRWSTPRR